MKEIILYVVFSITLFILLSNFLDTYNQKENFKQIVEGLTNNSDVAFGGNMSVTGNSIVNGILNSGEIITSGPGAQFTISPANATSKDVIGNRNTNSFVWWNPNGSSVNLWSRPKTGGANDVFIVDKDGNTSINGGLTVAGNIIGPPLIAKDTRLHIKSGEDIYMAGGNGVTIAKNNHPHWKSSGNLTVDGNISASKFYHGNSSIDANLRITFQESSATYYNAPAGSSGDWVHVFRRNGSDLGYIHSNGSYYQASDLRLKTNFEPLTNVIDSIKQIRGLKYNFKNSVSDKKSYGLIAQDVEKVFPELVTINEDGEKLKSISYSNMVPILVEAIKEQQKMIEELQAKIKMSR